MNARRTDTLAAAYRTTMRMWNVLSRLVPRHGAYAFASVCRKAWLV
jgi:hypothetical protein